MDMSWCVYGCGCRGKKGWGVCLHSVGGHGAGKAGGLCMGIQAMQHSESKQVSQLFFDSSYSLDSTLSIFM